MTSSIRAMILSFPLLVRDQTYRLSLSAYGTEPLLGRWVLLRLSDAQELRRMRA